MKKRVFLDSDVIFDLLTDRVPHNRPAEKLFRKIDKGELEGFTSPLVYANLFYLMRKSQGGPEAKSLLRNLRLLVKVLPMGEKVVDAALDSSMADFEDAMQFHTAASAGIDIIITRNAKDFKGSNASLYTPEEFLNSSI